MFLKLLSLNLLQRIIPNDQVGEKIFQLQLFWCLTFFPLDSVKAFLEKNRLGKYNEEEVKKKAEEQQAKEAEEEKTANALQVEQRCEVTVPGQARRRGVIKFIGQTSFKPGWWIGIHYDEPVGKNDGSVEGKRYFTCPAKYGAFVKPAHVTMGDFPELFDEEMDEM